MLIINADDYGRTVAETEAALDCFKRERITSATAMVFMSDSKRASERAGDTGIALGLHLNLIQSFTGDGVTQRLKEYHENVVGFLRTSKYAPVLYNPVLRQQFRYVYQAQVEEFERLYGRCPSHIDGHQHKHLCTNMLVDGIIPRDTRIRRSFSFWPGEKNPLNRVYRSLVDAALARRYRVTDYFFSLQQCVTLGRMARVYSLAKTATVELMTHPINEDERAYLMGDAHVGAMRELQVGTYGAL